MLVLEPNERILGYFRKHWIRFAFEIVPYALVVLVPFIFPTLLQIFLPRSLERVVSASWFLLVLWLLFAWVEFFILWTNYYLDVWVLTNRRLMNANQRTLFSREVATLELEKIQDIAIDVNGFVETFFGYGTIRIQTAGEFQEFLLDDAANPEEVKRRILAAQKAVRELNMERQGEYITSVLSKE